MLVYMQMFLVCMSVVAGWGEETVKRNINPSV
jgi:hypothetical protein